MAINDIVNADGSLNYKRLGDLPDQIGVLSGLVISPEQFTGTDLQKLQAAFDLANTQNLSIFLGRLYNITGGTIQINKAGDYRVPTIVTATNKGGIKKTDAGFMFSSPNVNVSDFVFQNVYFEGNSGVNVKVFDCSKMIRIKTLNCYYKYLTTVMYTDDTRFLQSIRMTGDTIIGHVGPVLDFAGAYDMVLTNVLMEASSGYFINHRYMGTSPGIYGVKIRDCAIEGITGITPAINFKGIIESLLIDGCYFETNNGGHIVFDANATMEHVTISNCRHGGPADVAQLIKWGTTAKGCFSFNNTSQNIGIHNATNTTVGRIYSFYDKSMYAGTDINPNNNIDYVKYSADAYNAITGGNRTVFGSNVRLTTLLTNQVIASGSTVKLTFTFPENIYSDDIISVQTFLNAANADKKLTINHQYRDTTTKTKVYVIVTNNDTASITIDSIKMTVLKVMFSVDG